MMDLIRDEIADIKISWKYHTVKHIILNICEFLVLAGYFTFDPSEKIYAKMFLFAAINVFDVGLLVEDADILLPLSDRERQNKVLVHRLFHSAKAVLFIWIGMAIGSRSPVLPWEDIIYIICISLVGFSWRTGMARRYYTGQAKRNDRTL